MKSSSARPRPPVRPALPRWLTVALCFSAVAGIGAAAHRPLQAYVDRAIGAVASCDVVKTRACGPYTPGVRLFVELPPAPPCVAGTNCRYAIVVRGLPANLPGTLTDDPVWNDQTPELALDTAAADPGTTDLTVWYEPIAGSDFHSYGPRVSERLSIVLRRP